MNPSCAGWVGAITRTPRRICAALVIIALASFAPGFFALPAIDRDEARFAQSARQMVASGDYVDIRLQDAPRYKKPIGIYWLQSAFVAAFGHNGDAPIWVHRLPSLIGAVGSVLLTYWIAAPVAGAAGAFLAGALVASSLILGVEARLAKTDAMLLATVLLAQGVLLRAYLAWKSGRSALLAGVRAWLYPALFWVAIAAGVLIKGPLIVVFVGLTAASLAVIERSAAFLKALRPVTGTIVCLALVLPWFVAIAISTDGAFFAAALGDDGLGKISAGQEGHGAPPFTHFILFWLVFWPGSVLFALSARDIWRGRSDPRLRFLVAWIVPAWIAFELVVTKLPHYLLPVFPALAIASALVVTSRAQLIGEGWGKKALTAVLAIAASLGLAMVAGAAWFAHDGGSWQFLCIVLVAIAALGLGWRTTLTGLAGNDRARFAAGLISSTIAAYWLFYPSLARIEALWPAPQIADLVGAAAPCANPHLVSAGYGEPSLVFATRTDILLGDGAEAAREFARHACAVAIVEERELNSFVRHADLVPGAVTTVGRVSGINPGSARRVSLTVFSRAP